MLNLLITIMGDIFDQIQESADAQFMFARAQIILEFEDTLSKVDRHCDENFPTWLQVLVPSLESENDATDWQGRVRALKGAVARLEKQQADAERERKEEVHRLEIKLEENEKQRRENNEELKQLLKIITSRLP